jgi:putative flippase GtrA
MTGTTDERTGTGWKASWWRSHAAALAATAMDFGLTVGLTEWTKIWYVLANGIGAAAGGTTSFLICRHWVFRRTDGAWQGQAWRYALASLLSMMLNTLGVWSLTEGFAMPYVLSKAVVATGMGVSVNYLVFRNFVFR